MLHQTKGFQRFEEKYERIVSNLEIDLEEWKRAAELARAENEALQMKMKKMRSQLEGAVSSLRFLPLPPVGPHGQLKIERKCYQCSGCWILPEI